MLSDPWMGKEVLWQKGLAMITPVNGCGAYAFRRVAVSGLMQLATGCANTGSYALHVAHHGEDSAAALLAAATRVSSRRGRALFMLADCWERNLSLNKYARAAMRP